MAENANGAEKSEMPTPRRLTQARDDGQVAYSHEASTAVELLCGFTMMLVLAPWLWASCISALRWTFGPGLLSDLSSDNTLHTMIQGHMPLIWITALFIGCMMVVALLVGYAQAGFHPTLKPLQPKLSKINPMTGFGRLFGYRGLMRFVLNVLKLVIFITLAWMLISWRLPSEVMVTTQLAARIADDARAMWELSMLLAGAMLIIGIGDLLYQRWQHIRDNMMTKQEVKEEHKQMEGNQEVKGKMRQMARQMAQRRMMQEVPKADVIITNPTHVAVALKYDQKEMASPVVLAKGYDEVAQKIKAIAAEHGIPMVENVTLARALAREVEVGHPIKAKWFKPVAEILAAVYRLKRGAA